MKKFTQKANADESKNGNTKPFRKRKIIEERNKVNRRIGKHFQKNREIFNKVGRKRNKILPAKIYIFNYTKHKIPPLKKYINCNSDRNNS